MRTGPSTQLRGMRPRHPVATPAHVSKGSHPRPDFLVEEPSSELDAQDAMGAGPLYKIEVSRFDGQGGFPFTHYPWITIAGPQLRQAPSLHNIWNAVPPVKVRYQANPMVQYKTSNRIRALDSFRVKLPQTGIFSLGGIS